MKGKTGRRFAAAALAAAGAATVFASAAGTTPQKAEETRLPQAIAGYSITIQGFNNDYFTLVDNKTGLKGLIATDAGYTDILPPQYREIWTRYGDSLQDVYFLLDDYQGLADKNGRIIIPTGKYGRIVDPVIDHGRYSVVGEGEDLRPQAVVEHAGGREVFSTNGIIKTVSNALAFVVEGEEGTIVDLRQNNRVVDAFEPNSFSVNFGDNGDIVSLFMAGEPGVYNTKERRFYPTGGDYFTEIENLGNSTFHNLYLAVPVPAPDYLGQRYELTGAPSEKILVNHHGERVYVSAGDKGYISSYSLEKCSPDYLTVVGERTSAIYTDDLRKKCFEYENGQALMGISGRYVALAPEGTYQPTTVYDRQTGKKCGTYQSSVYLDFLGDVIAVGDAQGLSFYNTQGKKLLALNLHNIGDLIPFKTMKGELLLRRTDTDQYYRFSNG